MHIKSVQEEKNILGRRGEELAAEYLRQKHFKILFLNWRPAKRRAGRVRGEVDIVARDPKSGQLVFVEVKTLSQPNFDELQPEDHFTKKKFLKLAQLAQIYLIEHGVRDEFRIDLVAINELKNENETRHYEGVNF